MADETINASPRAEYFDGFGWGLLSTDDCASCGDKAKARKAPHSLDCQEAPPAGRARSTRARRSPKSD